MEPIHPHRGFTTKLAECHIRVRTYLAEASAGRKTVRGFTITELLVVLAIIAVVSAVVITSQSSFNKSIVLSNTAYDIALSLRSSQSFGLGSRAREVGGAVAVNAGYGLYFQSGVPGFTLFADIIPSSSNASDSCHPKADSAAPDARPGNCKYDNGEKVVNYTFGNGVTISKLCAYASGWSCSLSSLDIVFSRPNPVPFIRVNGDVTTSYTKACVAITSPHGGAAYVSVVASGQITANATQCPLP